MNLKSLHVEYPRSPFKFSAFINALLFFMPHLGFEVVPVRRCPLASELQRRIAFEVSFAAKHQRRTASELQRRSIRASTSDCVQAPTSDCIQAPTPDCIRDVIDHLASKKLKGFSQALMSGMPSMEPATGARALCQTASEVVQFILCRDI